MSRRKKVKEQKPSNTEPTNLRRYGHYLKDEKPKVPKSFFITEEERNNSIDLMRKIFEVQSVSYDTGVMQGFLLSFIKSLKDNTIEYYFDDSGNFYVRKGYAKTYPCIVSHIDTVHDIIPQKDYKVLNSEKEFFAVDLSTRGSTGIGGDDKCGIYCCLDNLLKEEVIKLAFFVDEEVGCQGSHDADMHFFSDVSFVLQADRQGYNDVACVILGTEMFGVDFLSKIETTLDYFNRDLVSGGMTDVMQLAHNGLGIAMANFSCGYYNPHSKYEYVVIDELIATSYLFGQIITDVWRDGYIEEFERDEDYDYGYGVHYGNSYSELLSDKDEYTPNFNGECSKCGCMTTYDHDWGLNYCNNCMDYDYNSYKKTLTSDRDRLDNGLDTRIY